MKDILLPKLLSGELDVSEPCYSRPIHIERQSEINIIVNSNMIKIVSGGQTGVDRAALDAALECGIYAGGWCPEGRKAEDGVIPEVYPLKELPDADYRQRTKRNVIDSDGTIIIYFGYPIGGTELTIAFCISENKPYVLVDAEKIIIDAAVIKVDKFIKDKSITTLNVAGPRADGEPGAYDYARTLIKAVILNCSN